METENAERHRDTDNQDDTVTRRGLFKLAVWSYDRAPWILVAVGILLVVSLPWVRGLRIDADFSRLLDDDDALFAAFKKGKSGFGESNPLFISLTAKGQIPVDLEEFQNGLRVYLEGFDDISFLSTQEVNAENEVLVAAHLKAALLNQNPPVFEEFLSKLDASNMEGEVRKSRRKLVSLADPNLREVVGIDLLGVFALVRPYLEERISESARAFLDRGTRAPGFALIALRPNGSAEDSYYCLNLLSRLDAVCARTARDMNLQDKIDISFAGLHAMTAQSTQVLQQEMIQITLWATGLLLVLLWIALRRFSLVLICFLPLTVSMIVLLDVACLFFNPIYFITIGFVAIVLGLGLDVAVHLTGRLVHSLETHAPREAVGVTLCTCARPLLAGILSTAMAFLALLFTGKEAMIQFGLLTAVGLVVTLVTTYLLFPAFVRFFVPASGQYVHESIRLLPSGFFVFFSRHHRWCFIVGLVLLGLCVPWAFRFRFHMDLSDFFAQDLPAIDATQDIEHKTKTALTSTFQVQLDAPNLGSATAALEVLDRFFVEKIRTGELVMFESPSMFFLYEPGKKGAHTEITIDRAAFFSFLKKYKIKSREDHDPYLNILERVVSLPTNPRELSRLLPETKTLMDLSEDRVRFQITLWPSTAMVGYGSFSSMPAEIIDRELAKLVLPLETQVTVAGTAHLLATIQKMVKTLFFKVGWISLILVLGTVWICYRRFSATILSFVPLLGAFPAMIAGIVMCNVPVTPTAIAFAAIVFGVGIDDAVHLISQTRPPGGAPIPRVFAEIGPVITLTTASTAIGFGCLMWSSHPVVHSLGQTIFMGVLACWAFTLLFLPWLLRWGAARHKSGTVLKASVLLIVLSIPALAQTSPEDELLIKLQDKMATTQAVKCEFVQEKRVAQLEGIVRVEGSLLLQKPKNFRIETKGDEHLLLLCNGKLITLVDMDFQEVETFSMEDLSQRKELLGPFSLIMELDPDEFRAQYDIALTQDDGKRDTLTLIPKHPDLHTSEILITLDKRLRIRRIHWSFKNGDFCDTVFRKWRKPAGIQPGAFVHTGWDK